MKAKLAGALPPALRFWLKYRREQIAGWLRKDASTAAPPAPTPARGNRGLRVLVFDDHFPAPDRDAGSARMAIILKSLARLGECTFISLGNLRQPEFERQLSGEGVEIAQLIDYKRLLRQRRFDVALLSRPDVAGALVNSLRRTTPHIKIIFDTVDINFVRLEREYRLTGDKEAAREAQRYQRLETRLARSCDQIWCVTAEDVAALTRVAPGAHFEIIPTIHPLQHRGQEFAERAGLAFIGNYLHRPNVDAVHYFMREIYPAVRRAIPGIKVWIVGDNTPPEFAEHASSDVTITGYLADVDPIFQSCRIFIAPLRFGSGMKGKIGQALSYGLPVVTTSVGAEGMDLRDESEVLIADDANKFAEAVIKLYSDE
ncbi:MAG TPA: glycosyltransferase family 4 protein, partial [Pyrinomonadaceae bacterium]